MTSRKPGNHQPRTEKPDSLSLPCWKGWSVWTPLRLSIFHSKIHRNSKNLSNNTPLKFHTAPGNRPSQREFHLPTIMLQRCKCWFQGRWLEVSTNHKSWWRSCSRRKAATCFFFGAAFFDESAGLTGRRLLTKQLKVSCNRRPGVSALRSNPHPLDDMERVRFTVAN